MRSEQGLLYVVATPIGNLEDITLRALRVLKEVNWIAAEDTRHTRKLLTHYGIQAKLFSYREQNHNLVTKRLLSLLENGDQVALVSDAGMPGISDPGNALVEAMVQNGVRVVPIPGPCAAVTALVASGLAMGRFLFVGFLPRKPGERNKVLQELAGETGTLVFYESPNRIGKTLKTMMEVLGARRRAVVVRELTKLYETYHRASLRELAEHYKQGAKGEVTLLVEGGCEKKPHLGPEVKVVVEALRCGHSLPAGEIAKIIAKLSGLPRKAVYQMATECPCVKAGQQGEERG